MRQTSRAVALLLALETAQAADRTPTVNQPVPTLADGVALSPNIFNPVSNAAGAPTASDQLNSRTAGYTNTPQNNIAIFPENIASSLWKAATAKTAKVGSTAILTTYTAGSGCMQCIAGAGVWCSRTYAYLSSKQATPFYQYEILTYAGGRYAVIGTLNTDTALTGGAAADQGSCCETAKLFSSFIGTKQQPVPTYTAPDNATSAAGITLIGESCPAIKGGAFAAGPLWAVDSAVDDSSAAWSSWWCSNGLYKKVTAVSTVVVNAQQVIAQATNKRMELAQIGCPQVAYMCNNSGSSLLQTLTSGTATYSYTMPISTATPANTFSVNDKCTWVVASAVSAPTFSMMNAASLGLVSANWQIHNMEYTAASSWSVSQQSLVATPTGNTNGFVLEATGLANDSMIPLFTMPADQFASLRTWYGVGSATKDDVTAMSQNWMTAGQAPIANTAAMSTQLAAVKSQLYGAVANVPQSGYINTSLTTALTATQNYGKANSVYFDLRAMRYFPAMVAQTVWTAGSSLSTQYGTALASYNLAKTTWDAYVAILDKNAKQDAFAALFSPPKAPTVPPLPNMPWVPAKYSGYVRATAIQVAAYSASPSAPTDVASPTAQEFWTSLSAAQVSGGWGSFTATIFAFRNGWGKSFGTIGYSGDADRELMSDVWNYKWTCAAASTTTPPAGSVCESSYTAAAGAIPTTGTTTLQNTVLMFQVVSLWSTANGNTANSPTTVYGWNVNGLKLTFNGSAWKSGILGLTPIAANAAPVAAKSLSGIAGAQALAATSAAALAVAAALY